MLGDIVNNLNFFLNMKLISSEEIVIIFLFYNFIKSIIFGSIVELIWPTQFFNRRHNISTDLKYRSFTETIVKLRNNNHNYNVFNLTFLRYFFLKK